MSLFDEARKTAGLGESNFHSCRARSLRKFEVRSLKFEVSQAFHTEIPTAFQALVTAFFAAAPYFLPPATCTERRAQSMNWLVVVNCTIVSYQMRPATSHALPFSAFATRTNTRFGMPEL